MTENVEFWIQLTTLGLTIAGGFVGVIRGVNKRFTDLEGKIDGLSERLNNKLDQEIKHVHLRVDKLYMKLFKGTHDDV